MPFLCRQVLSVARRQGVRVVLPTAISTRKYAPLTLHPLPVTVVSMVTRFDTAAALSNTVTSSRF